ncbi:MAG: EF-P beta-lysylation protein EpmB [Pirellulaceae bacterium]|jgi:EF-P beta-lysylation protein EpmB|nr:EF-P beta-lysylation protein EpmB [Pirellulaceae bacterium]
MQIVITSRRSVPSPPPAPRRWPEALKAAVRDPVELCRLLDLPESLHEPARQAARLFPVFVPWEYLARIQPGDPHDPLLRQVLPLADELASGPEFTPDPVADTAATRQPGLLQKYAGRALLVTTPACAVHCRYCFRRHFEYQGTPRTAEAWRPVWECLAGDPTIEEIVLSGGDPLTLPDASLAALCQQLEQIPHLRRWRVHTRLPIMIPQRITDQLVTLLRQSRLTPLVVIHANHAAELDAAVADAVQRLVDAGIPVLNQSVLLRGVNDCAETLVALSRRLLELRVMPYYLHQLDQVSGAAHFYVPVERGRALIAAMRSHLPGYAVPRYVRETPGEPSKTVLA